MNVNKKISIFIFTFFTIVSFSVSVVSAQPYTPGETLNPACAPGALNCTVTTLTAQDEGVDLSGNVLEFNFTGGGVTSSILSGVVTVNVPAGWEVTGSDIFYDGGSVAIGTDTPVSSAILTLSSSTKGLLIPTNADPDTNITSPVDGLIAYDTTDDQFRGYVDGAWSDLEKVQTTTVHVTSAEILQLNSSPVELLPAPGVGKYYNILSIYARYNFETQAYGVPAFLYGLYGTNGTNGFSATGDLLVENSTSYATFDTLGDTLGDIENQPFKLISDNDNSDGDGTLDIKIVYIIDSF